MAKPVLSYYKIGIGYSAWWVSWTVLQSLVIHSFGFSWMISVADAGASQFILAIAGYAFNSALRSYPMGARAASYSIAWGVALTAIVAVLQRSVLLHTVRVDAVYATFVDKSMAIRVLFDWLVLVFIAVLSWFWAYIAERHESAQRKEDTARLARDAELSSLRMQLQPHFLFNSLNSISALVGSDPEKARNMVQQLSDFLRGTVRRDERQMVRLEEELQHLQLYLEIEKVRFGHRLSTVIDGSPETLSCLLPSLLLQPIVENAIKFGLYDTLGEITISMKARLENGQLLIEVSNPFDLAGAQPPQGTGFGLSSVKRRLYLLYYQNDLLATRREGSVFVTSIRIPQP